MAKVGYAEWDEEDAFDTHDERPLRRARRKPLPWLRLTLLSSLSIAGLVYLAQHKPQDDRAVDPGSVPATVLVAPAPVWKPISPSPAVYALEKSLGPVALEARQHTSGAREDTLALGRFGDPRHARITLVQGFAEPARSFFVDMVRQAAEAGLSVARNGMSRLVPTKFGPIEAAPMTLAGPVEQSCQAFRFSDPEAGFGFRGWLCGSSAATVDETQLACLVDGIVLAGGTNPSLKAVFARTERNRNEVCGFNARTASVEVKTPRRP